MNLLVVQGAAERGGAERVMLTLARGLKERGTDVTVGFLADGPFVAEVEAAGVRVARLGCAPRARDLSKARDLVSMIERGAESAGADVILANGEKVAPYVGWAGRRAGSKSLVWLHDAPLRSVPSAALQLALKLSPHDEVVAGARWMAERFSVLLRMPTRVIRHGIDRPEASDPDALRRAAGWDGSVPTVAVVGRLQQWKGAHVLLRAASRLRRAGTRVRIAVIGGALYGWEQDYAASLPVLAGRLGIGEDCWFSGHRDDAVSLMGAADVVAHCSLRSEPLGLVVLEAMALGRPVVATRTRGPEEVIDHRINGMLVPPGDDRALAETLGDLLSSPPLAGAIGLAATEDIAARWSAARMVDDFDQLLGEMSNG